MARSKHSNSKHSGENKCKLKKKFFDRQPQICDKVDYCGPFVGAGEFNFVPTPANYAKLRYF